MGAYEADPPPVRHIDRLFGLIPHAVSVHVLVASVPGLQRGVDAAPSMGHDHWGARWALLEERRGEERERWVALCSSPMTGIPCSGTDPYGSVAPVGGCRPFPSIAVPDPILHRTTLQG